VAENRDKAEASWRVLRNDDRTPPMDKKDSTDLLEPFNFYVHRASKTDPTAAPNGCDALLILVPCPTLLRNADVANLPREKALEFYRQQFDDEIVAKARKAVLKRLAAMNDNDESLKNLEAHIIHEVVDTPATYADQYNVAAGTPFALSHGFSQLSLTRPGAESDKHPNVLFVGASSRPGNGVPLVLLGAKLVAEKILRRFNI